MKKIEKLGKMLNKEEQKQFTGGVIWPCDTYAFSGSNGSGSSMTCDYMVTDAVGNVQFRCEVACMNGCNFEGCSFTIC